MMVGVNLGGLFSLRIYKIDFFGALNLSMNAPCTFIVYPYHFHMVLGLLFYNTLVYD